MQWVTQRLEDYAELRGNLIPAFTRPGRCSRNDWVIDLDIQGFFDEIDHELMLHAVRKHTDSKWMLLYIERWLKAPAQLEDGSLIEREQGTPQGCVISPLLSNGQNARF